jgi:hypothetical protein
MDHTTLPLEHRIARLECRNAVLAAGALVLAVPQAEEAAPQGR